MIGTGHHHTGDIEGLYVFAATIANDISARDVQLPQLQFFKGKSYRGFCPIGPWLTVLEPQEFALLDNLDLGLSVNGVLRQSDTTANLVFQPAETITELLTFANIAPGVRAFDRNAKRVRAASSAADGPAHSSTPARTEVLGIVRFVAAPAPGISQAR